MAGDSSPFMRSTVHAAIPCALLAACSDVNTDYRAAFVQQVLVDDNRLWLYRDAPKVGDKFQVMADDRYNFMRGSAALHFADLARPTAASPATAFLNQPEATTVLLFGDPHPENATVCRASPSADEPEPVLTVEFVDLDAAGYGPWTLDLRRAALGHATMLADLPGCDADCWEPAVMALSAGYRAGLEPGAVVSMADENGDDHDQWGSWFADLFEEALEEGEEQKKVNKYAPEDDSGERAFLFGEDTSLVPLTADEERVLDILTARMALPPGYRRLTASRRLGSGVSSQAAMRYVVLWDVGSDGPEDDALMQMREVIDPPVFPGRPAASLGAFADNHTRVVSAARQLWSRPDADPLHVGAVVDGLSWKAVSWTSYFQDVEHGKVLEEWEEGKITAEDLALLGADLGRVLGASHARTLTIDGLDARTVIQDDIEAGGGGTALDDEVLRLARHDLSRMHADYEIFLSLLETEGPLLGAENLLDGVAP